LLFDFRLVTGIDSSAIQSFLQIRQAAERAGVQIVLVGLSPDLLELLTAGHFVDDSLHVEPDLDRALEWCENAIIERYRSNTNSGRSLQSWFTRFLGDDQLSKILAALCHRRVYQAGEVISRQGEASQSLFFVADGRVGIILERSSEDRIRVRSLGRRTTVGEMGLITRQPRSATIEAELDTIVYELDIETFDRLKREQPELVQALLSYIISILAERLSYASRTIGVLKRS
jgi:SulP family sulfate permease